MTGPGASGAGHQLAAKRFAEQKRASAVIFYYGAGSSSFRSALRNWTENRIAVQVTAMASATGSAVCVGTVAVDTRVIPLGTRMYIVTNDGRVVYGMAVAADTGVRGNIVDLYYDTYQQCINFGRRSCTVYILA